MHYSSNYGSEEQTTQAVPQRVRGQAWLQAHVCRLRALDVPSLPANAHMPSAAAVATTVAAAVPAAFAKAEKIGCCSGMMEAVKVRRLPC